MDATGPRTPLPLVLLTGPLAPPGGAAALATALGASAPVLAPELSLDPRRPTDLGRPAGAVLAALAAAGGAAAVLCGLGYGALVALQVAADQPGRVRGLVLCTNARPVGTAVRSLHGGVVGLLPARTLQAWGGGPRQALQSLDQVRPLDYAPLAARVVAPVLVPYGEQDRLNVRPSTQLARSLAAGRAAAVTGAGPGWTWAEPDRYAALVAAFAAQVGA